MNELSELDEKLRRWQAEWKAPATATGKQEGKNTNSGENDFYETDYYDTNPRLQVVKKRANVSYKTEGGASEQTRFTNIYGDERGNLWYEIYKDPRKQMAISLLAQPFLHVASVIETQQPGKIGKFLSKVHLADQSVFLSKSPNMERLRDRNIGKQGQVDMIILESVFGETDKNTSNIRDTIRSGRSYYFYDFDHCKLLPYPGRANYLQHEKITWSFEKSNLQTLISLASMLIEMGKFYGNDGGEKFFRKVIDKTKYFSEQKGETPKEKLGRYLKEEETPEQKTQLTQRYNLDIMERAYSAKFDAGLLYKGLIARILNLMEQVVTELKARQLDNDSKETEEIASQIQKYEGWGMKQTVDELKVQLQEVKTLSENTDYQTTITGLEHGMREIEAILGTDQDVDEALSKEVFFSSWNMTVSS